MDSIPNINFMKYLPNFLDELFSILADNKKYNFYKFFLDKKKIKREIKVSCEKCIMEFLRQIREEPYTRTFEIDSQILDILVDVCEKKKDNYAKTYALLWIHDFLKLT